MQDLIKNLILAVAMIVFGTTTCMFKTQVELDKLKLTSNTESSEVVR